MENIIKSFVFFFNLRLVSELFLTYHIFINRLKLITNNLHIPRDRSQ